MSRNGGTGIGVYQGTVELRLEYVKKWWNWDWSISKDSEQGLEYMKKRWNWDWSLSRNSRTGIGVYQETVEIGLAYIKEKIWKKRFEMIIFQSVCQKQILQRL